MNSLFDSGIERLLFQNRAKIEQNASTELSSYSLHYSFLHLFHLFKEPNWFRMALRMPRASEIPYRAMQAEIPYGVMQIDFGTIWQYGISQ